MLKKPNIAIKLHYSEYDGFIDLANRVVGAMNDNLDFPSPTPTLAALQAQVDITSAARTAWGSRDNHGSSANLADLREKTSKLSLMLKTLSQYVMLTSQAACGTNYNAMAAMIVTSGFPLKGDGSPQGLLAAVRSFQRVSAAGLNYNQVKLSWEMPEGVTSDSNVKCYKIYRGTSAALFSTAVEHATVTKTSFVDTNNTGVIQTYVYWVVAVNSAGDGEVSRSIPVTLLSM